MDSLRQFAGQAGQGSGDVRWEVYLEKRIMEYIESKTVMRQYTFPWEIPENTFVTKIPTDSPTGKAVSVSEGAEIPVVLQTTDSFELSLVAYGTGSEITDEAKRVDWLGILGAKRIDEAAKRMMRKENVDIMAVLMAGAGYSGAASTLNVLKYEDLINAKTFLYKATYENPDTIFVNPDQYADMLIDNRFVSVAESGSDSVLRRGVVGTVSDMNFVIIPEIPSGTAFVINTSEDPLWWVYQGGIDVETYRIPKRRMDGFTLLCYAAPAMVKPEYVYKITGC